MEKRVKLGKKKLETLQSLQKQKQEINNQFQILIKNEQLVTGFILEDANIEESTVESIKLEGEELVVTLITEKPKGKQAKLVKAE